jgi:4-alpha-glucanotransferase
MVTQNRQPQSCSPALAELCRLYGVHTGYRDTRGRWRESPPESLVAVLRALGAEVESRPGGGVRGGERRLRAVIAARERELAGRLVEPVLVAWEGRLAPPTLRPPVTRGRSIPGGTGPGGVGRGAARLTLTLEDGSEERWDVSAAGDVSSGVRRLPRLPHGYHRLLVEAGATAAEATVISAPRRCWPPEPLETSEGRPWGIFAPLYALRSDRNWGAGDLADLGELGKWVAERGGSVVATLPLLASFLDDPFEPAPYRPVSRLFWNEFYLAVEQVEEWDRCADARALWSAADTQALVRRLRAEPLVDYRAVMRLKRQVLEKLAGSFFSNPGSGRREAFACYLREHPLAVEYASFRARQEGQLAEAAATAASKYHLYCQWQMEEQLTRLSGLFLDLPLGCHPQGFDPWRWPGLFAGGMSVGAPPDDFFAHGQDWTFSPFHPERIRENGHRYLVRCVRHHMRHARYLRIDHVMALHRLFWIPEGMEAADGVYVNYPAEEQYALLCLESQRNRTVVVGEDLGTVPPEVRPAMKRHGLLRTWVFQSELRPRAEETVPPVPADAVVTLNTHDMFPFAGFLQGDDIEARVETGQLDRVAARRACAARRRLVKRLGAFLAQSDAGKKTSSKSLPASVDLVTIVSAVRVRDRGTSSNRDASAELMHLILSYLACSPVALVLVNLEDLLLETQPQNIPGTGAQWLNWRRKAKSSLEQE